MITNKRALFGMALFAVFFCQTSMKASEQRQQQQNPFFPTVASQQELDDYRAIDAGESTVSKLTLSETFLTTHPESELKHLVHRAKLEIFAEIRNDQAMILSAKEALSAHASFYDQKMEETVESEERNTEEFQQFQQDFANAKAYYLRSQMDGYDRLNQFQQLVDVGEQALIAENEAFELFDSTAEKSGSEYEEVVQQHNQLVMVTYQQLVGGHQFLGNLSSIIEVSEKALELDPNSLPFLMMLSDTLASRPPEDEDELEKQMEVAEEYADKALDMVERLLSGPVAMQMSPEQKSGLTTAVRATLGRIYFNQEEFDDAREEYEKAIKASPRDSASYFFLGLCHARENEGDDALEALAKAVFLKGPEEAQARQTLQNIWETMKKDGDIETFIQEQGESIRD